MIPNGEEPMLFLLFHLFPLFVSFLSLIWFLFVSLSIPVGTALFSETLRSCVLAMFLHRRSVFLTRNSSGLTILTCLCVLSEEVSIRLSGKRFPRSFERARTLPVNTVVSTKDKSGSHEEPAWFIRSQLPQRMLTITTGTIPMQS